LVCCVDTFGKNTLVVVLGRPDIHVEEVGRSTLVSPNPRQHADNLVSWRDGAVVSVGQ
jgi:hypothetical protein